MAFTGHELTVSVQQSFPGEGTASSSATPVGTWPAGTYSFKVVAWYFLSNEGNQDDAGFIRTGVPSWEGLVVSLNDSVVITWTAANRVPDHYSVYYIENATWDSTSGGGEEGAVGRKIAQVNGDVLTATILSRAISTGTVTGATSTTVLIDSAATFQTDGVAKNDVAILNAGASTQDAFAVIATVDSEIQVTTATLSDSASYTSPDPYDIVSAVFIPTTAASSFVINPTKDQNPQVRQTMVRGYNGRLVLKSYALISPLDGMEYEWYNVSFANLTDYQTILKFIAKGTRVRIVDEFTSALVTPLDGYFVNADNIGTRFKNTRQIVRVAFAAELGTLT